MFAAEKEIPSDGVQPKNPHDLWVMTWQTKNRPLMVWMLVVLASLFFVGSFGQLAYLNYQMANPPTIQRNDLFSDATCKGLPDRVVSPTQCMRLQQERAVVLLEWNLIDRRYHQANTVVMFAVWARYLGFITGMILAIVGATFIIGKIAEPSTQVEAGGAGWKASISSTSPGLVMCFLGAILIVASITTLNQLQTRDTSVYFGKTDRVRDDGGPIEERTPQQPDTSTIVKDKGTNEKN